MATYAERFAFVRSICSSTVSDSLKRAPEATAFFPRTWRPPEHDLRRIMDAILYVDRTGIPWRYLPHDFAPWETVYGYFAAWQKDEVFDQLNGLLRRLVREAEGRDAEPSACVLDAQSIKTSANVPAAGQGIDEGKKIAGRKRHIGVDTLGLLLAVLVTAASVSDNAGGIHLLSDIAEGHPRITKAWADTGYHTKVINHGARLGIDVEVTRRDPAQKGFKVIPRRWVVERTLCATRRSVCIPGSAGRKSEGGSWAG